VVANKGEKWSFRHGEVKSGKRIAEKHLEVAGFLEREKEV